MELTVNGLKVLIDDNDAELVVNQYRLLVDIWGYVIATAKDGKRKRLQRVLTNAPQGLAVHHKNGNKLDNRKENLALMSVNRHGRLHKDKANKDFLEWCEANRIRPEMINRAWPVYRKQTGNCVYR